MLIGMPPKMAAASFMKRLKGACGKPFRPASKTAVFEVPCSFGPAVLDECIRRQSQCFLSSTAKASAFFRQRAFAVGYVLPFLVCKRPRCQRGRVQAFTKNGRALYGAAPSAPPSKVENEGRRRKKKCKPVRGRYGVWAAARAHMCRAGGGHAATRSKNSTRHPACQVRFWALFFRFFP